MVIIQESKSKKTTDNIGLRFVITQHSKDSVLFDNISNYLALTFFLLLLKSTIKHCKSKKKVSNK
jgi:hypothetical protein